MGDDELGSVLQPRQPPSEELDLEVELTGTQAGLYTFLKKKDQKYEEIIEESVHKNIKLAPMYIGALYALRHKKNPYRFSLAAHALRELIEKLLRSRKENPTGVPSLKGLQEAFQNYEEAKGTSNEENLLDTFLNKASLFFSKSEIVVKNKREKAKEVFQESKPTGEEIPSPLLQHKADELIKVHDNYFLAITHGKSASEMEFNGYVKGLEDCLLGMFNLRYGDKINEIIREIEKDLDRD